MICHFKNLIYENILIVSIKMCHCLDTRGLASLARDKHTPRKLNSTEIRKSGVLTEAESPAEPLGRSSAFTVTHFPFF